MIIKADEEGTKVIMTLCDIALKHTGMQNLAAVGRIIKTVELIPPAQPEPVKEPNKEPDGKPDTEEGVDAPDE